MDEMTRFFSKFIDSAVENPDIYPDKVVIMDFKTFRNILTPARMKILDAIKETKPKNPGGIARNLGRPVRSIVKDLHILENYGVLEISKINKKPKVGKKAHNDRNVRQRLKW